MWLAYDEASHHPLKYDMRLLSFLNYAARAVLIEYKRIDAENAEYRATLGNLGDAMLERLAEIYDGTRIPT